MKHPKKKLTAARVIKAMRLFGKHAVPKGDPIILRNDLRSAEDLQKIVDDMAQQNGEPNAKHLTQYLALRLARIELALVEIVRHLPRKRVRK